jgi:hypothetical protein
LIKFGLVQADMSGVSELEMAARKEAAAKITANRAIIARRLLTHSGIARQQGSSLGETVQNVDGACVSV